MLNDKQALKERATRAAEELKRRRQFEKYRYYKIPPYFEGAAKTDAHTILMPCPNKVGKSTYCLLETYWGAMNCHPYKKFQVPNVSWLVGPTKDHIREVFIEGFHEWGINKFFDFKVKFDRIDWANGSKTYVKSYDERRNIQGRTIKRIIMDEEAPPDIYMELAFRFKAGEPLDMLLAATPIDCYDWFADLCERAEEGEKGLYIIKPISIYDALKKNGAHLDDKDIERVEQLCVDEHDRQVRMYGKRIRRSGAFLPLEEQVHRIGRHQLPNGEIGRDWIKIIGIDPHPRKPTSVVWIAIDPKTNDAYAYDHVKLEGTCLQQVAAIKARNKNQQIFAAYIDPAAQEAMSSNMIEANWNYFDEFAAAYPELPLIKSVKQPEFVTDAVRYRLAYDKNKPLSETNRPHFYILDYLEDYWRSMKSVRWQEYRDRDLLGKKEQMKKGKEDDMMATGYALVKHPYYISTGTPAYSEGNKEYNYEENFETIHSETGY